MFTLDNHTTHEQMSVSPFNMVTLISFFDGLGFEHFGLHGHALTEQTHQANFVLLDSFLALLSFLFVHEGSSGSVEASFVRVLPIDVRLFPRVAQFLPARTNDCAIAGVKLQ